MGVVLRHVAVVLPLIGLAKIVAAQPPEGFGRGFPPRQNPLLSALDADGDGVISAEEIANAAAALEKLDKNGDGKLSGSEFRPTGTPGGPPSGDFVERIMSFDRNDDGKVTRDEMPEFMRRMLDRADANGDGAISKAEAEKVAARFGREGPGLPGGPGMTVPDQARMAERLIRFDRNSDGTVSRDELPEPMRERMLGRLDANDDGLIDKDELRRLQGGRTEPEPPAPAEDAAADTATHVEIDPLPTKFGAVKSLRLRADGNLLVADAAEGVIKVISPMGDIVGAITPGFRPEVIAIGRDGTLYCGGEGLVAKIDAKGQVVTQAKLPENAESEVPARRAASHPPGISGLAVSDDALFVTFGSGWSVGAKAKLFRYSLDLEDPQLLAEGLRACCQHCDIDCRDGVLYLAENSAFRVVLYDREGEVLHKWGSKSRNDLKLFGSCCNPMNITFDASGTLYTAESGLGRVKRYTPDGEFLGLVGYLDVERFNRGSRTAASCCHIPIAVTPEGERVYVTDVKENIIRVLQKKET